MVEYIRNPDLRLDLVFAALADHSRRKMLVILREGSRSISDLAESFRMSFAGVAKHIAVLEGAGLVRKIRAKSDARSFQIELNNSSLNEAFEWLTYHRDFWNNKLDRLEKFIEEEDNGKSNRKSRKKN